jgi:hypothetical protein
MSLNSKDSSCIDIQMLAASLKVLMSRSVAESGLVKCVYSGSLLMDTWIKVREQ